MNNRLVQNAAYNVFYRLLNVIFPLLSATYLARVLSPDGIGKVAYAQNIISYFMMFAVLGNPAYGTREIARAEGDEKLTNRVFSELFVLNFLSSSICILCYFTTIAVLQPDNSRLLVIFSLDLFFNYINIDWFYQGKEEYKYITIRSIIVKVLSILSLVVFVKDQDDCVIYALILCCGIGCNNLFNVWNIRNRVKFTYKHLNLQKHLRPIATLMVSVVAASLYNKVDITMLGWIESNSSVGYYTNAHKVVSIVLTLVTSLSAVFLPRLSFVYYHKRDQFDEYISAGLKVILMLAIPSCLGMILVADDLTGVMFGPQFAPAARTIQILSVFTIVKGVGDLLCYQAIVSSGQDKALVKSRVVAGLANVILNLLLIPRYSHNGAAIASVISEIIVNGIMLKYALTITTPRLNKQFLKSLIVSSVAMTIVVAIVQKYLCRGIRSLLLSVISGLMVYCVGMIITKNEMIAFAMSRIKNKRW